MKTNKKGISLIVLVITIIVMIILSAAIIISLTSNDIIDSAKEATNASDLANAKQAVMVAEAEWEMEPEEGKTFKQYAEEKLIEAGFSVNGGTGSLEVTKDADVYVYPTIPNGYVASKATGESKVSEGLVIYQTTTEVNDGNVDTARTSYNQYVWVPVEDITTFERVEWGKGLLSVADTTSYKTDVATEAIEYNAMKASVEKYGGFYIARYELGQNSSGTAVIRKNANSLVVGLVKGNWDVAKKLAKEFSLDTVEAHLIYGEEWDAALNFIAKEDEDYLYDSREKAWYERDIIDKMFGITSTQYLSGVDFDENKSNMKKNIYDMAGYMAEFTMETVKKGTEVVGVTRGGYTYSSSNGEKNASYRSIAPSSIDTISLRVALYLK